MKCILCALLPCHCYTNYLQSYTLVVSHPIYGSLSDGSGYMDSGVGFESISAFLFSF